LAPMVRQIIPVVVTLRVTGVKKLPRELLPHVERPQVFSIQAPDAESFRTGGSGVITDPTAGLSSQ
jgi:hypothetical protein